MSLACLDHHNQGLKVIHEPSRFPNSSTKYTNTYACGEFHVVLLLGGKWRTLLPKISLPLKVEFRTEFGIRRYIGKLKGNVLCRLALMHDSGLLR